MAKRGPTADKYAAWLTPIDALNLVCDAFGYQTRKDAIAGSVNAIIGRLKGGMIKSRASQSTHISLGSQYRLPNGGPISSSDWGGRIEDGANLWQTGDVRISIDGLNKVSHFGVKFDPKGIRDLISSMPARPRASPATPKADPTPAAAAPAVVTAAPEPLKAETPAPVTKSETLSIVSDAHLSAWYDFYRAVVPRSEQNDERMLLHFRQCFLDKSVTRARLRGLRGEGRRGPKPAK